MKSWKLSVRIVLFVALMFGVAAVLPPSAESAPGDPMYMWTNTPEAQIRTSLGDCPTGHQCKEWTERISGVNYGTGDFSCFPN